VVSPRASPLHWLSDFYLREQTPADLKTRFLAYVVAVTQGAYTWTDEVLISQAYDLLDGLLPAIKYVNNLYSPTRTAIPEFGAMAQRDEAEALSAAEKIRLGKN